MLKTILITGSTDGIGLETARALVSRGHTLLLHGRNPSKLEQAEKELSEANDLLVAMQRSLDNWKKDVLGFREEMRQAEEAQMKALVKVLSLLGAEPMEEESDSEEEM